MARRSTITGTLPISFYNLGSTLAWNIDLRREVLYTRMHDRLAELAVRIPVFLVNEAQMDSITPYHLTRGLNKRGVGNVLREALAQEREQQERLQREGRGYSQEEPSPLQRAWDNIQRDIERVVPENEPNSNACWVKFTPVGLYVGRFSRLPNLRSLCQYTRHQIGQDVYAVISTATTPAIFICPERVVDWANRLRVDPNLVFDKVLYHELGHAYMDKSDSSSDSLYNEPWARVIEESLANWIAFSQFNKLEARYVQRLISTQPAEYQGYLTVLQTQKLPFGDTNWEYHMDVLENWIADYGPWWLWRAYDVYPLKGVWIERFSPGPNTRRLWHWRRFKQARSSSRHSTVEMEERFWQSLAAQVLLEV